RKSAIIESICSRGHSLHISSASQEPRNQRAELDVRTFDLFISYYVKREETLRQRLQSPRRAQASKPGREIETSPETLHLRHGELSPLVRDKCTFRELNSYIICCVLSS